MNNCQLVIVDSTKINECENLIKQKKWRWSFMGVSSRLRERIIIQLGSKDRYFYAEELQNICIDQKGAFLDWLAEIGRRQDGFLWWATNVAYKIPCVSDLFLNYCYLILIKRWIDAKVTKRVIILENPWLLRACLFNFGSNSVNIIENNSYFLISQIKHKLVSYGRLLFFLLRSIRMWVLNKVYSLTYYEQLKNIISDKVDILSCTWIESRSFSDADNRFSDPYLGTLNEYYKKKGLKVITTTLPVFPVELLRKAYKSNEIIPSIYFVKLSDIIRSCFKSFFLKWDKNIPDNNGLDFTLLFDYEKTREKGGVCYVLLHYLACLNMFRSNKLSFRILIYPFENQPWDKMMVLAKKASKSKWKIVGCHNIGVPFFYLNFFLGEGEDKACPQPDLIASNGSHWQQVLKNAGFSCTIENGGSLRFSSKTKENKAEDQSAEIYRDKNVLVLLSTFLYYSLDLIFFILRQSQCDKTFYIKPHPDTPEKVIRRYLPEIPDNFIFVRGSIDEWMNRSRWAIHVGTTAAFECMMHGIIVFKYLPERIDLDPLLGLNFRQKVVTDREVLKFKNKETLNVPDNSLLAEPFHKELWNEILE
ncbi:MAG: hypothetical protein JSW07_00915 [bacterium]|nr:MAG: hypothetical protein JSW07_00915 [bacterium]